jgi:hypothetical protein
MAGSVRWAAAAVGAAFGALSLASHRRGTHGHGVGATGSFRLEPDPSLPTSPFFRAGQSGRVLLRHANLAIVDDAGRDVRGCALRLESEHACFDLLLNSGDATPFWDVPSLMAFLRAVPRGPAATAAFAATSPKAAAAAASGAFRAPSSYASLPYAAGVTYEHRGDDGVTRAIRFRVRPDPLPPPAPREGDHDRPWEADRRPTETRPVDYLRHEYAARLEAGPIVYRIDAQCRDDRGDDAFDCGLAWDRPWRSIGRIVVDRALDHPTTERLALSVDTLPAELTLPAPRGARDPRSIAWLRARAYPLARAGRTIGDRFHQAKHPLPTSAHDRVDGVVVRGRLVHDDAREDPLHHVDVELWDARARHAPLAVGRTDLDGRFEVRFPLVLTGGNDGPSLRLVVKDHPMEGGPPRLIWNGPVNFHGPTLDLGALRVAWWEYDATLGLPRADRSRPIPQGFVDGYWPKLLRGNLRHLLTNRLHHLVLRVDESLLPIDRIQGHYPETLSTRMERAAPGSSRSDRFLGDRVLNGLNPWNFRRFEDGGLKFFISWDDFESTGRYDLVNVTARFEVDDVGILPTWIELSWRVPGHTKAGSPTTPPRRFTPADGPDWEAAKRVLRVQYSIAGELDTHLCQAHLNVEQYAMAAWRNLRVNPVARLLLPHLREVVAINRRGDQSVVGPEGVIPQNSALTTDSAIRRMRRQMGRLDHTTWRPRAPLCDGHRYALAANLFWEVLEQHVGGFVRRHRAEIARSWVEIRRMSDDLVRHSVPWAPLPNWQQHVDLREIDDPTLPRATVDGVVRALRPVTTSDVPDDGDFGRLEQLCRYVIYHATFYHTWENDSQVDDGGEVRYATLGLRNGSLGPEHDDTIGPTPGEATDQLYFAHTLGSPTPGRLVANEQGDVPASLIEALVARRAAFAELGFPIERIRSRVNI